MSYNITLLKQLPVEEKLKLIQELELSIAAEEQAEYIKGMAGEETFFSEEEVEEQMKRAAQLKSGDDKDANTQGNAAKQ